MWNMGRVGHYFLALYHVLQVSTYSCFISILLADSCIANFMLAELHRSISGHKLTGLTMTTADIRDPAWS